MNRKNVLIIKFEMKNLIQSILVPEPWLNVKMTLKKISLSEFDIENTGFHLKFEIYLTIFEYN
jgi:hypothetical protein